MTYNYIYVILVLLIDPNKGHIEGQHMTPNEIYSFIEEHQEDPTNWMLDPIELADAVDLINLAERQTAEGGEL